MIDYIKGKLTYIEPQYIVLESGGIGYQIQMGNPFRFQHREGGDVLVFTYQHVREDILALYGFVQREERMLFEKLLHVSGIGPKGALSILTAGTPSQIIFAIQNDDVQFLTRFPGVGKKTAQRLILDLKDKLDLLATSFPAEAKLAEQVSGRPLNQKAHSLLSIPIRESIEALAALGYSEKEIDKITPELKEQGEPEWGTDRYIKLGLQLLMK
jgi:Holliday junction DNA helicase RuvA